MRNVAMALALVVVANGCRAREEEAHAAPRAALVELKKAADEATEAERRRIAAIEQGAAARAPLPAGTVKVTVTSDPPGAQVFRAPDLTAPIGTTPYVVEAKANSDFDVLLKLQGYSPATRTIDTSRSSTVAVPLARASGSSSSR